MPRSLTLFVRHELERDRRQELAAAGVAVVIDHQAPSCAIAVGEPDRLEPCRRCAALDRQLASSGDRLSLELLRRDRAARARRRP